MFTIINYKRRYISRFERNLFANKLFVSAIKKTKAMANMH